MSDDTDATDVERRLREALARARLPSTPDSLRDSLSALTDTPRRPARRGTLRRSWLRAMPAIAAVVVVAVVVGMMAGGLGRLGSTPTANPTAVASAAASAGPVGPSETPISQSTTPPSPAAPPTSVHVLDAAALAADIEAVAAGKVAAHDVVANVGADPVKHPAPLTRECADPLGSCTVVAVLDGFDASTGAITTRQEPQALPPPSDPANLTAPLALRLVPGGPIELLGHVDLAGSTGQVDAAGLKGLTASTLSGHVVAVLAWLGGVTGFSCGPVNTAPPPFNCPGSPSFINDQPVMGAIVDDHPSANPGTSITPTRVITGNIPDTAALVQMGAYQAFAPSPVIVDGVNGEPRFGMYLVRMVAVDNADCQKCRGWLLVGRLDATPSPATASGAANAGQRVYSAEELETALDSGGASLTGKAVLVDGRIEPVFGVACVAAADGCVIGALAGTRESVWASAYTRQLLAGRDPTAQGVMAMQVRPDGLEYLGEMAYPNGVDFVATITDLKGDFSNNLPLMTFIVSGWLGTTGPTHCLSAPGPPPPADTPFGSPCPSSWLATTNDAHPSDMERVQYAAYQDFAPGGAPGATEPKFGTYLVRLVVDTRQGLSGPRGWQVVARLAP